MRAVPFTAVALLLHVHTSKTRRRDNGAADCARSVQLMSHAVVSVDERALKVSYVDMRCLRKSHGMQSVEVWEVEVEGVRLRWRVWRCGKLRWRA